jgi:GH35 family endo-1,4-beta-xylanase
MGTMTFYLPPAPGRDALRELEMVCLAGGPDNMPWPTQVQQSGNQLLLSRPLDESGYLVAPCAVRTGSFLGSSATLMERPTPYNFLVELARGKVNQLRNQLFDWRTEGLVVAPALQQQIQEAVREFGRTVQQQDTPDAASRQAQSTLDLAYDAARQLVQSYVQQVFNVRHQRAQRLETRLGCRLGTAIPDAAQTEALRGACNAVCVPLSWHQIESAEGTYNWDGVDAALAWAEANGLPAATGPLVDFSSSQLPAWLWLWERDLPSLATFMCKFVERAVRRYRTRIRRWHLTAASNCAMVLSLGEDELLGLTYRLVDIARQVDPSLELVVGLAQPWGEYMAQTDRTHSPYLFADTLIRSGLNLAAIDLELVMGVTPRGSWCRDLMDTSRLLDLYALLGVPLQTTLGYPAAATPDPDADPELRVGSGRWEAGFSPEAQAEWAAGYAALVLCKPAVQAIHWTQRSDVGPHQFPHCGLFDAANQPRPVLQVLRQLREQHLS